MIAALFALAAAMAIGGCAAVIQGFPYVRLESGLAMVIAGSVAASSGAVLFGLGVVATGLRRVERTAARLAGARPVAEVFPAPAAEGRPRLPPVLPPTPAFAVPPVVEPAADAGRPQAEPGPVLHAGEPAEPQLPMPGLAPEPRAPEPTPEPAPEEPPAALGGIGPEDDLFAAPEAAADTEDAAPKLRSSLDAAPPAEPAPEAKPARTVVGRYASGGNTYVMFEDGSIEAETPQGRFTFASLDELKAFVDGGGESGARATA